MSNISDINNSMFQSGENQSSQSFNKDVSNSFNTTNIYNILNGITVNKPDEIERPCLENFYNKSKKNKCNRINRYYGYLTTKCIRVKGRVLFKVLNILTSNGTFVDDHVWLDLKLLDYKNEYKNNYDDKKSLSGFIEFEGYVDKYKRNNKSISYEIKITSPVIFHRDKLSSLGVCQYESSIDEDKLMKYSKYKRDELFDLIDKLQKELNDTVDYYGENYIFFYIINLLTLNTAKENIYKNNIERTPMSDKLLRNIITTMASLLYKINTTHDLDLEFILKYTTNIINLLQNVSDYKVRSNEFELFCVNDLGIKANGRSSEGLWEVVNYRQRNFGTNPNIFNLNVNDISLQAWQVLQYYI